MRKWEDEEVAKEQAQTTLVADSDLAALKAKEAQLQKQVEGMSKQNQYLRKKIGQSIFVNTSSYASTIKELKQTLAVLEIIKKLEDEVLKFDLGSSHKDKNGLYVGVIDTKTNSLLCHVKAIGADKHRRYGYSGSAALGFWRDYEYKTVKAWLVFQDKVKVEIPRFLLEDFAYLLTDHINNWSKSQDKIKEENLDKILEKLEA